MSGDDQPRIDRTLIEQSLIEGASRGDSAAVDALLQRHFDGLHAFVRKQLGPAMLARESSSDVVQSVCREVLEDLREHKLEYQGEAAFKGWLYQAALHKIADRHRHHHAEKRGGGRERVASLSSSEASLLAKALDSPSRNAAMREELERLAAAFEQLGEHERMVVHRVYLQGLSHARVAEELACTEEASRKTLSRALAKLSRLLA